MKLFYQLLPLCVAALDAIELCSCDCCGAEMMQQTFACALVEDARFMRPYRNHGPQCSGVCRKPAGDQVLANARGQVDYQRFCFYDCAPLKQLQGATCTRLTQKGVEERQDASGNGHLPPVAQSVLFTHYRAKRLVRRHAAREEAPASQWDFVMSGAARDVGSHAEEIAEGAEERLNETLTAERTATQITEQNKALIPSMVASLNQASEAAKQAYKAERLTEELRDEVREAARRAAEDVMQETIEAVKKEERAIAKKKAKEEAEKLKAKMLEEAPKAAAKAMKPYNDALSRAAATAGEYTKRGDGLSGESASAQFEAQMLLGQANQWQSIGETAKAQKLMQQAHQLMDVALGLSAQANSMYNTGKKIIGTLGAYAHEAAQAAYHAEVMMNPDAPPPPAPLV